MLYVVGGLNVSLENRDIGGVARASRRTKKRYRSAAIKVFGDGLRLPHSSVRWTFG